MGRQTYALALAALLAWHYVSSRAMTERELVRLGMLAGRAQRDRELSS